MQATTTTKTTFTFEKKRSKLDILKEKAIKYKIKLNKVYALAAFFHEYNQMPVGENRQIIIDLSLRAIDNYYHPSYLDKPMAVYLDEMNIPGITRTSDGALYFKKEKTFTEKEILELLKEFPGVLRREIVRC